MIYFISGHRDLTVYEFEYYYIPKIKNIISTDRHARFVIGNWKGCDQMTINFLKDIEFDSNRVTIYYSDRTMDSKISHFRGKICPSDSATDEEMTMASDLDIAFIRPGREDSYTAMNLLRRYLMKK